ncbi:MAG: HAD family phosphatase [Lachnospiraceae bacterium]|nr:HAD family phosphatase [Lachnospiraceae bacterium]
MTEDKKYKMIAFDMDGTLLNRKNRISEETEDAIREAAAAGKAVVIATGRSLTEVLPYREQFGGIHYAILESGAMLYDLDADQVLKRVVFGQETVEKLEAVSREEDILLQVMADGRSYIEQAFVDRLEAMGVAGLREFVEQCETVLPDIRTLMRSGEMKFEKINFYHTSQEARLRSLERVREIDAEGAFSADASLEMSPPGVTKGNALRDLAEMFGISVEETIAVGDSGNDIAMLEVAGLAVAMGNADDELRAVADVTVASNNDDGCAEAIRRYLV